MGIEDTQFFFRKCGDLFIPKGVLVPGKGGRSASPSGGFTCSGDSNLLCENFDGGTTHCVDDGATEQDNCWVVWTSSDLVNLTVNNQAAGLEGTYGKNLQVTGDIGNAYTYTTITTSTPVHSFVIVNIGTLTLSNSEAAIFALKSADGNNDRATLDIKDVSGTKTWVLNSGGVAASSGTPTPATGTWYIWLYFDLATTTAIAYISSTSTKPAATITIADSGAGSGAGRVYCFGYKSDTYGLVNNVTFDKIRVGSSAFGNNGE